MRQQKARPYLESRGWQFAPEYGLRMFRDRKGRLFNRQQAVVIQSSLDHQLRSLPKRHHLGCDDLCEDCVGVMKEYERRIQPVLHVAFSKFWDSVRAQLPQLRGDVPAYAAELNKNQMWADAQATVIDWLYEVVNAKQPNVSECPCGKCVEWRAERDRNAERAADETAGRFVAAEEWDDDTPYFARTYSTADYMRAIRD